MYEHASSRKHLVRRVLAVVAMPILCGVVGLGLSSPASRWTVGKLMLLGPFFPLVDGAPAGIEWWVASALIVVMLGAWAATGRLWTRIGAIVGTVLWFMFGLGAVGIWMGI